MAFEKRDATLIRSPLYLKKLASALTVGHFLFFSISDSGFPSFLNTRVLNSLEIKSDGFVRRRDVYSIVDKYVSTHAACVHTRTHTV